MKIRLDDIMQSFSYPFNAVYYYYIPLETVLMFANGVIYGKAVHGIATEEDVRKHADDFIRLPDLGEEGRKKVMSGFVAALPAGVGAKIRKALDENGLQYFENAIREEKLLLAWFNYRDGIYTEFSRRWCEENDLELIG